LKSHIQRLPGIPFISENRFDFQFRQELMDIVQTTARQSDVIGVVLRARNDSRLIVSREAHRLSFVEFRILERCQADEPVAECGRQHVLGNIDLIAQDRGRTVADSTGKSSDSGNGAAKSAAIDPELAELAAVWPSLSAIIKSVILGVARQHLETGKPKK
jgi:hypothetical protein